jgi:condensin complex subunit 3
MKAYISVLCKMLVMLRFRVCEQKAIKCLRGMLNVLICRVYTDKDHVKDLTKMGTVLKMLDECPSEDLPDEQVIAVLGMRCALG